MIILLLLVQPVQSEPASTVANPPLDTAAVLVAIDASPFEEPIHLESKQTRHEVQGHVYAILDVPFAELSEAVASPRGWCEILFLHYNIKACVHQRVEEAASLAVFIGRKYYQDPEVARQTRLGFYLEDQTEDQLALRLEADRGPLGVRAFQIKVRAVPLDEDRSLMRLSYSLGHGRLARFVMQVYFSTSGRDRIGFTVEDDDQDGTAEPVGGMRGMIERNTMRFFFAITSYLRMPDPRQQEARHVHWFEQTERYPEQLREMDEAAYLAQKRRERRNQDVWQAQVDG
ncbi:MAG: hypothetical protein LC646_03060 [Xanthomonadaceae bacterium]|nr:hypothetical protein [Xanthomonadaceae bacterium]